MYKSFVFFNKINIKKIIVAVWWWNGWHWQSQTNNIWHYSIFKRHPLSFLTLTSTVTCQRSETVWLEFVVYRLLNNSPAISCPTVLRGKRCWRGRGILDDSEELWDSGNNTRTHSVHLSSKSISWLLRRYTTCTLMRDSILQITLTNIKISIKNNFQIFTQTNHLKSLCYEI